MARLLAIWCVGLISTCMVAPVEGQSTDETRKDASRRSSRPVRVGGVDFEIVAEATWERPAEIYGTFEPRIELRISNHTDQDLTFELGDALRGSLSTADGPELVMLPIPKRHFPKPFKVAAGKSVTVAVPMEFVHTRIRHVCLGAASNHAAGTNWLSSDILPGKYHLRLLLENMHEGDEAWVGKMRTEALDIEVKSAG